MKKLMISMLAMAAMVSCTNEIENPDQPKVNENDPVAITFGSSIVGIQTKAVTESSTQFENDDKIKVYGYKGESSITGYLNSEFMKAVEFSYNTTTNFTATDQSAVWERGATHHFFAVYPSTLTITEATSSAAPSISITTTDNTGIADDIMYAQITGDNAIKYDGTAKTGALAFSHKLAKIKLVIKTTDANVKANLSKIVYTVANSEATLDIVSGTISNATTAKAVSFTKDLTSSTQELSTTDYTPEGFSPMILPTNTVSSIVLTINGSDFKLESGNLTDVTISAGNVTTITLTVGATGVGFTSSITAWDTTTNANGTGSITQ